MEFISKLDSAQQDAGMLFSWNPISILLTFSLSFNLDSVSIHLLLLIIFFFGAQGPLFSRTVSVPSVAGGKKKKKSMAKKVGLIFGRNPRKTWPALSVKQSHTQTFITGNHILALGHVSTQHSSLFVCLFFLTLMSSVRLCSQAAQPATGEGRFGKSVILTLCSHQVNQVTQEHTLGVLPLVSLTVIQPVTEETVCQILHRFTEKRNCICYLSCHTFKKSDLNK